MTGRTAPKPYGPRVTEKKWWSWMRDRPLSELALADRGLHVVQDVGRDDPLWPGQLATLIALLLYLALPSQLTVGPGWPLPVSELAVLTALFVATRGGREARRRRAIAIGLVLVAALANLVALGRLTDYLVGGGTVGSPDLLGGGALIWVTNLLLFAVLDWELDRGGPVRPSAGDRPAAAPDFLFPQMSDDRFAPPGWKPGFGDYLYVSLTNQTAFSPTDTMPLTLRVKVLMGIQGVAALITTGVIIARAVNTLG